MLLHIDIILVMQNHIRAVVNIGVSESAQLPRVFTANYNKILQNPTVLIDLNFWWMTENSQFNQNYWKN